MSANQPFLSDLKSPWRIGIDVGGTFTDLMLADDAGATHVAKVPSVPSDPSRGVVAALERLAMREAWRRGGVLRPGDLSAFLPEEEAERLLEGLAARGLCRKEGEGYRF